MERIHHISEIASWYIRQPNPDRKLEDGITYRKGWEARLILNSLDDLALVRSLLSESGFKIGEPFQKHTRWVQPLYGRVNVERFLEQMKAKKSIDQKI